MEEDIVHGTEERASHERSLRANRFRVREKLKAALVLTYPKVFLENKTHGGFFQYAHVTQRI